MTQLHHYRAVMHVLYDEICHNIKPFLRTKRIGGIRKGTLSAVTGDMFTLIGI
jgi:hypothetical protein